MRPYGIRDKFRYNYPDFHTKKLGKGWLNWWKVELNTVKSKKSTRQKIKKLLRNIVKKNLSTE